MKILYKKNRFMKEENMKKRSNFNLILYNSGHVKIEGSDWNEYTTLNSNYSFHQLGVIDFKRKISELKNKLSIFKKLFGGLYLYNDYANGIIWIKVSEDKENVYYSKHWEELTN